MYRFLVCCRIKDNRTNIFNYKGNTYEENRLYEKCKREKLCLCVGKKHICNTPEVAQECFPQEQSRKSPRNVSQLLVAEGKK